MKNGKMPISAQKKIDSLAKYQDTEIVSLLDVDPRLKEFLESQGLAVRWINAPKYVKSGSFDKNGWKALRMDDVPAEIKEAISVGGGTSPEGFFVRNDLLLAVRGEATHARHKNQLKDKALRKLGVQTERAGALKEQIGQIGKVHEGYDENE